MGTETIVRAAGVTRGALYHQFADKTELFAAVFEAVEEDIGKRIGLGGRGGRPTPRGHAHRRGAWLDACAEPEVQQIVLLDAPAVLGWERWREIGMRYGWAWWRRSWATRWRSAGCPGSHCDPLAHVVVGALDEAALYVARADDPAAARRDMGPIVHRLVKGLAA